MKARLSKMRRLGLPMAALLAILIVLFPVVCLVGFFVGIITNSRELIDLFGMVTMAMIVNAVVNGRTRKSDSENIETEGREAESSEPGLPASEERETPA